jgi:hypothetical protein
MKTQQNSQTNEVLPDGLNFVLDSIKELFALRLRRMDTILLVRRTLPPPPCSCVLCVWYECRNDSNIWSPSLPSAPQIGDWHVWFRSRERSTFRRNNQPDIETTHCKDPVSKKNAQYGRGGYQGKTRCRERKPSRRSQAATRRQEPGMFIPM